MVTIQIILSETVKHAGRNFFIFSGKRKDELQKSKNVVMLVEASFGSTNQTDYIVPNSEDRLDSFAYYLFEKINEVYYEKVFSVYKDMFKDSGIKNFIFLISVDKHTLNYFIKMDWVKEIKRMFKDCKESLENRGEYIEIKMGNFETEENPHELFRKHKEMLFQQEVPKDFQILEEITKTRIEKNADLIADYFFKPE